MQTIKHQFSSDSFYIPTWEVQHLFVGTFNPEGGARVPYYYGREKNQFWRLVSEITGVTINPSMDNFFELLRQHKIACVDLIHSVFVGKKDFDLQVAAKMFGQKWRRSASGRDVDERR